jgi:opacity protein-like surface antigen
MRRAATFSAAAIVAVFALTVAAQAQSLVAPVVTNGMYQPGYSAWDGFYVGAQAGLVATKSHEIGGVVGPEQLFGDTGGNAGVFAGYRFTVTDWLILGVDAEANTFATEYLWNAARYGAIKWDAAVRATLGYPVAPNVLAFGTIGYSWAHFDMSPGYGNPNAQYTGGGVQLGLGVDMMVTENLMARFHATWALYGVNTVPVPGGGTSEPSDVVVRVGAAWRF